MEFDSGSVAMENVQRDGWISLAANLGIHNLYFVAERQTGKAMNG